MNITAIRLLSCARLAGLLAVLCFTLPDRAAGQLVVWGSQTYRITNVPAEATNVVAFEAGYIAALALRGDGSAVAWGGSSFSLTNIPASATNLAAVAAGVQHMLALRQDGVIVGWGDTTGGKTTPPASATNVTALSAGSAHSLALRGDGRVVAWGSLSGGSPVTNVPASVTNAVRVAAGRSSSSAFSLALRRDGTVVPWGLNNLGLLTVPANATNLVAVAAGVDHALALRADGTVVGWGNTLYGACTPPASASNIVAVAAGGNFTMALRNDGAVLAWGTSTANLNKVPTNVTFAVRIAAGPVNALVLTNTGAPVFVDALSNLTAYWGRDFTLNALAVGQTPLAYQWRYNETDLPGANQPTLTLTNVQFTNAGAYSVVVSNALGTITGLVANVGVELAPAVPSIQEQPQSQTVFAGTNVSFSVVGSGNPAPAYQWQFNSVNIPAATSSSYTIPYVLAGNAGSYRVILTNNVGTLTSAVAVLTVNAPPWPVFTSHPADQAVSLGAPLTLKATASGSTPVSFQWRLNGTNLPGVTGPTVSFSAITYADAGRYSIVASNSSGTTAGPEFSLTVVPVAAWGVGAVTNLPSTLSNAVAIAAGYQHAVALKADGTVAAWGSNTYGQASVPLGLSNVVAVAAGDYHCLALKEDGTITAWGNNNGGQISLPANATNIIAIAAGTAHSLALRADGIVLAWGDNFYGQTTVPASATNVVAIAAYSDHNLALRADGTVLPWGDSSQGMNTLAYNANGLVAIAAGDSFNLALRTNGLYVTWGFFPPSGIPTSTSDVIGIASGSQHILLLRTGGRVTSVAGYNLFSSPRLNVPTWLTNAVAVAAGYDFSLALARPAGGLPILQRAQRQAWLGGETAYAAVSAGQRIASCRWRFNGANLPGATGPFLALSQLQAGQSGDYSVVVSDTGGAITSSVSHLSLVLPPLPQITQQPVSRTAGAGANVTFAVTAAATIPAAYQWQFNGNPVPGATGARCTVTNVQAEDMGSYQVLLTNWAGAVTSQVATLSVTQSPPTFVLQPYNRSAAAGAGAVFSALAVGTEPLSYQWQFNGTNLPDATHSALTLAVVDASSAGAYHVTVTNIAGSITSTDAVLSLTPVAFWGDSSSGQADVPAAATNLIALAAGGAHVLALSADGTVTAWGGNACGQTTVPAAATNVLRIAAGESHSLALRADGTVLGWGNNYVGQAAPPAGLSNVVEIAAGTLHSLALLADGTVAAWGNSTTVPTGVSNAVAVSAGGLHSLVLLRDGTLATWGNDSVGQTDLPPQATNLVGIAAGFGFSAGLRADGNVIAWGSLGPSPAFTVTVYCGGYSIQTGGFKGTNTAFVPVEATNIVAIAAGKYHILALRADGAVIAWGDDSAGQVTVPAVSNVIAIAAGGNQSLALEGPAAPQLGASSPSLTVGEASALSFNFAAAGLPPLSASWQFDGTNLTGAGLWHFIPDARLAMAGQYALVLTNAAGVATGTVSLTVTAAPPVIVLQPAGLMVGAGSNVTLRVQAQGSLPMSYQWQREGLALADGPLITGSATPTLTLLNVQTNDTANYNVVVTNFVGSVVGSNATLLVLPNTPLTEALDATALEWTTGGDSAWRWQANTTHDGTDAAWSGTLTQSGTSWVQTAVSGPVAVSFWWKTASFFESLSFAVDGTNWASLSGSVDWQQRSFFVPGGSHLLRWIAAKTTTSSGWTLDSWLDQVSLGDGSAPLITSQPSPATGVAGASAKFTVGVTGTEPFGYQWQQDEVAIPGATNVSLTVTNIQPDNTSGYRVVVTNLVGAVTSQVVSITVCNSMPVITWTPVSATTVPGFTASFSATINGTQPLATRWQFNQSDLPGATGTSLVISNVQYADAGSYRVIANNDLGTAFSRDAVLTVVPVAAWGLSSSGQTRVPADVGDVVALVAGYQHSLALRRDGSVITWGAYWPSMGTLVPAPTSPLVAIAGSSDHDIGLFPNGTVAVWGVYNSLLAQVPTDLTNAVAVASGIYHALALRDDGRVVAWGDNGYGQAAVPPAATDVVAIGGGMRHSLALREDGTVLAWGDNEVGQLDIPRNLSDAVAIAAGDYFNLALREDGTLAAWGDPAICVTNLPGDLTNIVAIAAGEYNGMALRSDGTVVTWGKGLWGSVPAELTNVIALAGGYGHYLALVGDGRPAITVPPFRRKVVSTGDARLQVMAVGAGPLSYQWQLNGTNIPGATGRTLPLGQVAVVGNYSVVVSNALGTASSSPSVVTPALRFDTASGAMGLDQDGFHLRLLGLSGRGYPVIYASTNLSAWQPIFTNVPVVGTLDYLDSDATNQTRRFYRAVETDLALGPLRLQPPLARAPLQGTARLRIDGLSGLGPAVLYRSTDLPARAWEPIATNPPAIGSWELSTPVATDQPTLFFRVLEQR